VTSASVQVEPIGRADRQRCAAVAASSGACVRLHQHLWDDEVRAADVADGSRPAIQAASQASFASRGSTGHSQVTGHGGTRAHRARTVERPVTVAAAVRAARGERQDPADSVEKLDCGDKSERAHFEGL